MPVESWLNTEEVPDFAAHATAMIDAALTGSGLTRESYWAAVRKGYNTPYNDPPKRRALPNAVPAPVTVQTDADSEPSPALVAPAIAAAEIRAV